MTTQRRQRQVHVTGSVAGATAAVASAPFGAAKLRDSFKESYPHRFGHGLGHLERVAQHRGLSQQATGRVLRVASRGRPGFVPLATASAAAATAGGARRYERHLDRKTVGKSAFGVELAKAANDSRQRRRRTAAVEVGSLGATGLELNARRLTQQGKSHLRTGRFHATQAASVLGSPAAVHHLDQAKGALAAIRRSTAASRLSRAGAVGMGLAGGGAALATWDGRTVTKSAFGVELGKAASHRTEAAATGTSALTAYGAHRTGRTARGHLVRAADLERAGSAALHSAHGQGAVVAQRLVRHTGTGTGALPRTAGNLAGTGRAHLQQQAHLERGIGALDQARSATAAGQRALRQRRGKLVLATGLAGAAAGAHRSRRY